MVCELTKVLVVLWGLARFEMDLQWQHLHALSESTSRTSFVAKTYTQPLLRSVFRSCSRYTKVDFGSPNGKVHYESTYNFQIQHQ